MNSILHARLIDIRIGLYQFNPGVIATIATVVMLYVMMEMGSWQWEKGQYREDLETTVKSRMNLPPVELHLLPASEDERKYLPVMMRGRFDTERQFLHDNRIFNRHNGYHVYTPFHTDSGKVVLVNRGWQPLGRTRQDLPAVAVTDEVVTIYGLADTLPAKGVVLADYSHPYTEWPQVLQYLDIEELKQVSGLPLLDMMVWMKPETEHGYYRQYPALDLNSEKNFGYAFQWYAMIAALCIIYLVVNTKKIRHRGEETRETNE